MPNINLNWARAGFHRLFPLETRNRLYLHAPESVKWVWDQLGGEQTSGNVRKDVLFAARLLWFHEPSDEVVQRWATHAARLGNDFKKLAHDMRYDIEATQNEHELKNKRVPADADYVDYATRLFLRRELVNNERIDWLQELHETEWTLSDFVSNFEQSEEYQQLSREDLEPHLVELDKFKLYVRIGDFFTSGPIAQTKEYEPYVTDLIGAIVRPGDYVVDAGANVGYHALNMATIVGEQGKVFAFEPLPANCELINLSIKANNLTNLELFPDAAGNAEGKIEILVEGDQTNARINSNPDYDSQTAKRFPVRVVRIDDCLSDIPRLRFVKIDVEGQETAVLQGARQTLARWQPNIQVEIIPAAGHLPHYEQPEIVNPLIINFLDAH